MEVTFPQAEHVSIALKDRSYDEIYTHLVQERAYNARMPDGAVIQMMYVFEVTERSNATDSRSFRHPISKSSRIIRTSTWRTKSMRM